MQKRARRQWLRKILTISLVLIVLFIISCLVFDHYYQFRRDDQDLKKFYSANYINATIGYYQTQGRKLRYVTAGDENAKGTLVFLHGSLGQ
jgi:hypothetical protein